MKINVTALDERAKTWMAVTIGAAALSCIHWELQVLLLCVSLAACIMGRALAGGWAVAAVGFVCLAGTLLYRTDLENQTLTGLGLLLMALKFGPFMAMMLFLYKTMNPSRFLRALEQMKAPAVLLVPLAVTFRFMPSLVREFGHIRDAMAFRGMPLNARTLLTRPFRVMEFILVPLLMRCLAIGEELSRSALCRGMGAPGEKTAVVLVRFTIWDAACCGVWTLGLGLVLVLDRKGGLL